MVPMDVLLGYAIVLVVVFLCCALVDSCFLGPSALCLVLYVVTHVCIGACGERGLASPPYHSPRIGAEHTQMHYMVAWLRLAK
jgi:hypothetical protein